MRHLVLKKKHFLLNTAYLLFVHANSSHVPSSPSAHQTAKRLCHKEYSVAVWHITFYHFIWSALFCVYRNGCQGQVKIIPTLWLRKKK